MDLLLEESCLLGEFGLRLHHLSLTFKSLVLLQLKLTLKVIGLRLKILLGLLEFCLNFQLQSVPVALQILDRREKMLLVAA